MEPGFRHYTPRWPLTEYVEGFWSHGHYAQPHERERVMPTGTMNLVFRSDDSGAASIVLAGAHSTHVLLDTSRPFSAMAASFKPGGGFPFFGLPAGELQNTILPLETVLGTEAHDLRDRCLEARTTLARFHALESFLLVRLEEHTGRSAAVLYALRAFHGAGRVPPVASVAARIGWTATRFIATFRDEVGLAPKAYCRVARFHHVLASLARSEHIEWTDLALSSGYFDQAHFIHDFKDFSGVTPSQYLRDRVSARHVRVR